MAGDPWITRRLRALRGFLTGENRIRTAWLGAAESWADRVKGAVMGPFRRAGHAPDASMILSQNDHWQQQLAERLRPSILGVLRSGWASAFNKQPPAAFDQSTMAQAHLVDSLNRMVRTPDDVYREIAAIVADGINEGQSIPDIAARVDEQLTVSGNENWHNRATVVARTETQAAMQAGSHAAASARQADDGEQYDKIWLATMAPGPSADRTRPTHRAADQQRVPLDEPFTVGEAQLLHPGDQTGPAAEVIQCRCSVAYVLHDEPGPDLTDRERP